LAVIAAKALTTPAVMTASLGARLDEDVAFAMSTF
jgi:hypothetical protein